MKKLIIILSIFGLFILVGCNTPDANINSDSVPNTTDSNPSETNTEPSESTPSTSEKESKGDSTSSQTNDKEPESTLPDYDDGKDWHGTID